MSRQPKNASRSPVLIVEDSTDFSNLMKFIVDDMGLEGIPFPLDKESIVEWSKEHRPSLILMDLALRKKDGMEYIRELKADSVTKHIPIIIITGRELNQKELIGLELNNVKYLRKGRVEMNEIKRAINEAVQAIKAPHPATKK
ncbi:MAG: response regulator [Ignavibacteriae bacterium]|nr:response regulator [Ignavibacteriota bacterium]